MCAAFMCLAYVSYWGVYVRVRVCMRVHVYVCMYMCVHVCICVCMYVYVCACVYMWACVHARVCHCWGINPEASHSLGNYFTPELALFQLPFCCSGKISEQKQIREEQGLCGLHSQATVHH